MLASSNITLTTSPSIILSNNLYSSYSVELVNWMKSIDIETVGTPMSYISI